MFYKSTVNILEKITLLEMETLFCFGNDVIFYSDTKHDAEIITEDEYVKLKNMYQFKTNNQVTETEKLWDAISFLLGGKDGN